MSPPFDPLILKVRVAHAIASGPRGTQARLAEHLGITTPIVNRWAKAVTVPPPPYWGGIETFFGWAPGTIVRLVGFQPYQPTEIETAIRNCADLTELERNLLVDLYRLLRAKHQADAAT
jgi:hypothetical protein